MASDVASFRSSEILVALVGALAVELGLFLLFALAGGSGEGLPAETAPSNKPVPIAVKPVMDDLPLLKLGGKRVKAKLPDMWQKQAPVRRYEAKSAPSPDAEKTPEAIPTSEVAERDAEAPPPDAQIAKEVDPLQPDASWDAAAPNVDEEGSPDGVKGGTETDPLKARAVSRYTVIIMSWFNQRFRPPLGKLSCEELKGLSASVVAQVGSDRTVTAYNVVRPSGNGVFDAQVRATMDAIVGQGLPPPPADYPDILGATVTPRFSGNHPECQ